jgi:tetratricopeptide (TPR) repeat protein
VFKHSLKVHVPSKSSPASLAARKRSSRLKKILFIFPIAFVLGVGGGYIILQFFGDKPAPIDVSAISSREAWEQALPEIEKTAKSAPTTENLLNWAKALRALGRLDESLTQYQKVLQEDPDNTDALDAIGKISRTQGNTQDAQSSYLSAIKTDKTKLSAYLGLSYIYIEAGNYPAAIDLFKTGVASIQETDTTSLIAKENLLALLGRTYYQSGDYQNAKNTFEQVLALNENNAMAANYLQEINQ